ncbi:MAG TPA: TrkH family potassium uptake protein [Methanoregulaceae archaeon]|nr:MAG: TrkH family potassium uptake protein [Methanolinea sp.]HON82056.1 TrkH family potassium uptake protein [Methanoregulaceae archaeon]HPD10980.1 TrkH family potassium uptake protein [Methanoregulaceae archaeon]HRT15889.1 TrkH family potassium uptake protein [Methanoregulaceae archaeon]HRU31355.1 TrkH family potassium uptake protein [Methanoregulaceae archaeon]
MKRLGHLAIIAHDMGLIFEFLALITIVPFGVLLVFQEWDLIIPMGSVPFVFIILGFLISKVPKKPYDPSLSVALVAVALTWLVIAAVGALPFVLALKVSWTDAVFEAMSGWTGTGFTVMNSLDTIPRTLVFWRSFMQWVGGIGVIAFGVAMLSHSGLSQSRLYRSEGRSEALMPSVVSTGRRMWVIYFFLTVMFTGLVLFSEIPLWDAVNLVMVSIATGGFSLHDAGMSYYNNELLEILLIPVMMAGALPFKVYFLIYRGKFRAFFRDPVVRLIIALSILGSVVVAINLYFFNNVALDDAFRQGFFCTISGYTCTGLQDSPLQWTALPLIVITLLMMIGGAAGSTSGGIKTNRVILGYEGLVWWFKRLFVRGSVIVPFKHEGRNIPTRISEVELSKNMLVIFLYVIMIFIALLLALHLAPTPFEVHQVVFELVSAASNVGLGIGYLTPASPDVIKWLFIFVMWIGRLEIIPVLILAMGIIRGFEPN